MKEKVVQLVSPTSTTYKKPKKDKRVSLPTTCGFIYDVCGVDETGGAAGTSSLFKVSVFVVIIMYVLIDTIFC